MQNAPPAIEDESDGESDASVIDAEEIQDARIEPEAIVEQIQVVEPVIEPEEDEEPEPEVETPTETAIPAQVPVQLPAQVDQIEHEIEPEAEEETEPAHDALNTNATQLYTESEIGSPSIHATPDMPVRHGSFSFASLPPREALQSIRQQSLGLDSDATEDEPVYVRAPELIAHEERMRAYEESSPQPIVIVAEPPQPLLPLSPGIGPSDRRTRSMTQREHEEREEQRINELRRSLSVSDDEEPTHTTATAQPTIPSIEEEEQEEEHHVTPEEQAADSAAQQEEPAAVDAVMEEEQVQAIAIEQAVDAAPQEGSDEASADEQSGEELAQESTITQQANDANTTQDGAANRRSRLRAPPRNLGRPVRPTTAVQTTQHIRINSLVRPRPVNTAPVAVHNSQEQNNQETRRVRPKPPTQFARPAPRPQGPPPKSFTAAQRKKEADERAAERDAATKKLQKERRDNKHEELRTKKREEQEAAEAEARRKSNEFAQKHLKELDQNPIKRAAWEVRQEREEAAAAEKKRIDREKTINRQNALQGRLYGSSSIRPTMLELNQPARPASRLDMHNRDNDESNNENVAPDDIPQRSVHDQVTRASARPAATLQRPIQRQSQQESGLPSYPSSLHRAPLRGSALQRPGSIFQTTTQTTSSTINAFPAPPTRAPAPDMRQYATQRPPMANEMPTQPQTQRAQPPPQQAQSQASSSRPQPQANSNRMRLVQAIHESSPIASNISLPEIHTDSSDDDSDRASLPSWASPGHVFQNLSAQEMYDTDRIFGRIKRVAIDDIFGTMPAEKRQRLNMRTSSANWVRTGDALTQVEVIEDREGREAIRNAGGWVYGVSDYHNHELRSYNTNNNQNNNNSNRNMNQ